MARLPLDLPPGINGDDTEYGAQGRWGDGNNVRFRLGRPQTIGGWEALMDTLLTGVCRAVFPWTDNLAILNIAFGTHQKVELWQGGDLFDITPFGPPTPLGTDPFTTINLSAVVSVDHTAHGYTTGLSLKLFGADAVGGITPAGTFTITVDDVDTYHFTFTSPATSGAVGGGSAIVVTPQTALPAGAVDGTGSVGIGTGGYGDGPYGETPPTADYFPRTWDFGAWGENLVGGPRNGGFYQWDNDTTHRMVAIDNAPTQITYRLVAPMNGGYMAFALGCNEEASGEFNPMNIRHCGVRQLTQWSTLASGSTSREYTLTGGGRIVAGRMIGPYLAVWTTDALWVGTFTGALNQPWNFQRQGFHCGLIGPNAVVVVGQTAFWVSVDRQFYRYDLGGAAAPMECPIRQAFADHLATSQGDKIMASANAEFEEIRFDYPDGREGFENSRYVAAHVPTLNSAPGNAWYRGIMARTAFVDASPSLFPLGVTFGGQAFYHEKGFFGDGQAFANSIRTAAQLLDVDWRMLILGCWPDFQSQMGPVTVSVTSREHPQGVDTTVSAPPMAPDDQKADFLITGRLFETEFSANSAPTSWRLGRPVFEVARAGRL